MNKSYTISSGKQGIEPSTCILKDISAEQKTIVNNMLSSLTAEAKYVLYVVFNTPNELTELLFRKPTKEKIYGYLDILEYNKQKTETKEDEEMMKARPTKLEIVGEVMRFAKDLVG